MWGRLAMMTLAALAVGGVAVALALAGGSSHHAPTTIRAQVARARPQVGRPRLAAHRPSPRPRPRPLGPGYWRDHVNVTAPASESGASCVKPPPTVAEHPIRHRRWLRGVTITEYYPAPERWFIGRRIAAPGLSGTYAADWLYSARGLAMEGDGVDLHGHPVHIAQLGSTGWDDLGGRNTVPVCLGKWSHGFPVWLIGGWRNRHGAVTFPLASGGWANGTGKRTQQYGGVTFAPGLAHPLYYYRSIAVDPGLIPLGSRVYVPAYRKISGGWFIAQDTGGAIRGRHIDVYRPPPARPADEGRYMTGQRVLVIPPG
jgi:3D (Asp-Asp-Asp) domain-containing protein